MIKIYDLPTPSTFPFTYNLKSCSQKSENINLIMLIKKIIFICEIEQGQSVEGFHFLCLNGQIETDPLFSRYSFY